MKRVLFGGCVLAVSLTFLTIEQHTAFGGRGGGGRGGGGGNRGGGGGGGGMRAPVSRPSPNISRPSAPHTPSLGGGGNMQRPSPNISRPSPNIQNPNIAKPNINRPAGGNHDFKMPSNAQRPAQLPNANRPPVQVVRPNDDFKAGLNKGGLNKPSTLPAKNPNLKGNLAELQKKQPGLFDRPGGDGRFPNAKGPGGKGPNDRPSKGDLDKWLDLPKDRPGNALRPGNDLPGVRPGDWNGKNRPGQGNNRNDFVNNIHKATGIGNKNIGNTVNIDMSKNANFQQLNRHANVVQNNLRPHYNNWFNNNWWGHHNGNWPRWHYHNYPRPASWWWRPCTWAACTAWVGAAAWGTPFYYDYGSNVVTENNVVYVNQEPVASAPVYAQQAIELADAPPPPEDAKVDWMPLGTFALSSKKDDDEPSTILQLALSKDGLVSGTWYNRQTDKSADVEGRVDPDTQRLALRKPDQPDVVLEVGVYNLTQAASPCLMHFGTLNTQTWYLVRLDNDGKEAE